MRWSTTLSVPRPCCQSKPSPFQRLDQLPLERRRRSGSGTVPGPGVVVVGRPCQPDTAGEGGDVLAVGVGHVLYAEGIS